MACLKLWETGELSDVKFVIKYNGSVNEVAGHRCIFGITSPVFRAMLYGEWIESQNRVITLEDISVDTFMAVAKFMYTTTVELKNVTHAISVYNASQKYLIDELKLEAHNYLFKMVDVKNVLEILEFSTFHDNTELTGKCADVIRLNSSLVLSCQDFKNCQIKSLEFITDLDVIDVTESQLFNSVREWAEYNSEKEGKTVEEFRPLLFGVLSKIRFLTMTPSEFIEGPGESRLLNEKEQFHLIMNINKPGSKPLPEGFSTNKKARCSVKEDKTILTNGNGKLIVHEKRLYEWHKYNVSAMLEGVKYYSPSFTYNNFPFRFLVLRSSGNSLYFNLQCDATDESNGRGWSCRIRWKFTVISQKTGVQDFTRKHTFNENGREYWGSFGDLFWYINKGYINGDKLLLKFELEEV